MSVITLTPTHFLIPKTGVYVMWLKGVCIWVGQTVNLFSRVYEHMKEGRMFDTITFAPLPVNRLDVVENELIARMKPLLNRRRPYG